MFGVGTSTATVTAKALAVRPPAGLRSAERAVASLLQTPGLVGDPASATTGGYGRPNAAVHPATAIRSGISAHRYTFRNDPTTTRVNTAMTLDSHVSNTKCM